jgi:2,3-bisphosphoglycerate-dependent phosphoglycerate mutase
MTVGLKIDNIITELGSASFVHSFFSTVSHNLEKTGWGSRFPVLLNELYPGTLSKEHAAAALAELKTIKAEFTRFSPEHVIWDIDDLSKNPPWGNKISPDITNLSNYFVTSTGRDLFDAIEECLLYFALEGSNCEIVEI